ncbi:MAG: aldo/keto reductase [Bacteroidota bacterium]
MIYKTFGKTGIKVSAIGFGGMRFGESREESIAALLKARELGINYFDTAPGYCGDRSEDLFGEAFRAMPKPFYVSTKSMKRAGGELREQLERSLRRLGVPKIDFFHIWCVLSLDDYRSRLGPGGAYEAALRAKEEGLIGHICLSTHASGEEIAVIAGEGLFAGVTLGYNAANFPFRRAGLRAAHAAGMGIVTMNPLGGGLIPQNGDYFAFLRQGEETVAQAALRFNAAHPEVSVALPGMGTVAEVVENAKALENLRALTAEEIDRLEERVSQRLDALCTGCGYCSGCPEGIEIPKYMDAYNMIVLKNDEKAVADRLRWHWGLKADGAARCAACGLCEQKCTQHLPIVERLRFVARNQG